VFKIEIFILVQLDSFANEDSTLCLEFTLEPFSRRSRGRPTLHRAWLQVPFNSFPYAR
jgi:hypothetical protein